MVSENWLPRHGLGRVVLALAFLFIFGMIWLPILEMF